MFTLLNYLISKYNKIFTIIPLRVLPSTHSQFRNKKSPGWLQTKQHKITLIQQKIAYLAAKVVVCCLIKQFIKFRIPLCF